MNFLKIIVNKPLFKFSSLNGLSVLLKIIIGVITSKIIAIFVGPGGMALVGNLRNFLTSVETVSLLGFQNGTVKYVAENKEAETELKKIISTVFFTLFGLAIIIGVGLFFLAPYCTFRIFGISNSYYDSVFKVLAIGLPFYVANFVFTAILNGLGKYSKVIYISILGNIISLIASVFLISNFETFGALLAVVVSPPLLFFVSFYFLNSEVRFLNLLSLKSFHPSILSNLFSYTLMALASGVLGPVVFLAVRNNIITHLGEENAGYWEAMSRISSYYMMFITTLLSVYFLPKLVLAKANSEARHIFLTYYRNVLPVLFVGMLVLYFLRDLIIKILFTSDFEPVSDLFFWQLVGDFFKAASLILGYQMLAKKMATVFIVTEIISLGIFYFLSSFLMHVFGIEGVVMAHVVEYTVYLLVLVYYFRKQIKL